MTTLTLTHPRLLADDASEIAAIPARHAAVPQGRIWLESAPATNEAVHPAAIGLALSGYGLFLIASWAGWAFGYTALLITVIYFLSAVYFGMLIDGGMIAAASRGETLPRSFRAFVEGQVQTLTGAVSGRNALVQIAFMPLLLGLAMCFFAVVWRIVR